MNVCIAGKKPLTSFVVQASDGLLADNKVKDSFELFRDHMNTTNDENVAQVHD